MPQSDGVSKLKRFEFDFDGSTYKFNINPEEYTLDEPTRLTVTQTKGGAWIDQFGAGVKSIFMRGTTGMNGGAKKFKELRDKIRAVQNEVQAGQPVEKELVFHNFTDDESWVVTVDPAGFKLMRSKQNPLLYMYEIRLIVLRSASEPKKKTEKDVATKDKKDKGGAKAQVLNLSGSRNGRTPVAVAQFVGDLQVLNNGQVPINEFKPLTRSLRTDLKPSVEPFVSVLSVEQKQRIDNAQEKYDYNVPETNSFLDWVIYKLDKKLLPNELEDGLKLIVLELTALASYYYGNNKSAVQKLSKEDMKRYQNNIRWVGSRLEEYDGEAVYEILTHLRQLDVAVGTLAFSDGLYEQDTEQMIQGLRGAQNG